MSRPQKQPIRAPKVKKEPKNKSNSKVRIEKKEMKVIQLHELTLKQCLDPSPTPKIARQGPTKYKMTPKLSQNQISELKETKKMKVVQLHKQTKNQLLNPTPTPKIASQGPKKSKKDPKIKSKSNNRIEGNIENESCSTT